MIAAPCVSELELDVPACVERVRRHDEHAARELLNHLYPLVIKLIRAHLPRRTSEDDLAQTVFMKIFSNIDRYSGTVPLEHWVSRIAINTCLNQLRVEKIRPEVRRADLSEDEDNLLDALTADRTDRHPTDQIASRDLVSRLLETLSPPDRLVIHLLHLEERSVDEVRQITGWNRSMIKVRAFRARQKLKKHLATLLKGEIA